MSEQDDDERKERVLHTRVPESLERQLKHRARRLGMSVSTVVRHVLLNTFGLVEDVVNDSVDVALALAGDDAKPRPNASPLVVAARATGTGGVLAWQEAVLNRNAVCERCNAILVKGKRAALGIPDGAGARVIICPDCLEGIGRAPVRLPKDTARR